MLHFSASLYLILYGGLYKCPKLILRSCSSFPPGYTLESSEMLKFFYDDQGPSQTKLSQNLWQTALFIGMFSSFVGDPNV